MVSFTPWPLYHWEKGPWYLSDRSLCSPWAGLTAVVKRKIKMSLPEMSILYSLSYGPRHEIIYPSTHTHIHTHTHTHTDIPEIESWSPSPNPITILAEQPRQWMASTGLVLNSTRLEGLPSMSLRHTFIFVLRNLQCNFITLMRHWEQMVKLQILFEWRQYLIDNENFHQ
jgi:hypothetical protein